MSARAQTKEALAYAHLRELIESERYQVGDLLPSETELAGRLSAHRLTVAKALNSLKAEGYVERARGRGTTLLRKPALSSSKVLLVISPAPVSDPRGAWYFSRLLYSIQNEAFRKGFSVLNASFDKSDSTDEALRRLRDLYHTADCKGVIVVEPELPTHQTLLGFLSELNCTTVWAGSNLQKDGDANRVDIDNRRIAFELTERLIGLGAKRIAFIGGLFVTAARRHRYEGYRAAIEDAGLPFDESYAIRNEGSAAGTLENAGRECAAIYAARNLDADAIFLNDYHLLDGIRDFCRQHDTASLRRLSEIPIATFDYDTREREDQIRFSVAQPIEEIGAASVEVFDALSRRAVSGRVTRVLDADINELN